jgi:hypothetical protein
MWTPKQRLHPKIIDALYMGGFSTLQIEFLGWLSYNAAALNNSRNPVKAAHTILAKANDTESNMHRMLLTFENRKMDSIEPTEKEEHEVADKVLDDLEWAIKSAITKAQMSASDYEDHTKQGVSDGVPMTKEVLESELAPDEEDSDE